MAVDQERLKALAEQWLAWDVNEETRKEISTLLENGEWIKLNKALGTRIAFGTAGICLSECLQDKLSNCGLTKRNHEIIVNYDLNGSLSRSPFLLFLFLGFHIYYSLLYI